MIHMISYNVQLVIELDGQDIDTLEEKAPELLDEFSDIDCTDRGGDRWTMTANMDDVHDAEDLAQAVKEVLEG